MSSPPQISDELRSILENFVYQVLKSQPSDLYKFSADYFSELYTSKNPDTIGSKLNGFQEPKVPIPAVSPEPPVRAPSPAAVQMKQPSPMESPKPAPAIPPASDRQIEEDEEDDDIMDMPDLKSRFSAKSARRQSVAAESFDPEKIDSSEIKVYEKTDEQKTRLQDAVKDIFIFRSLEQKQIPQLIDAMFERAVEKNEVVIKQGNDGDNFYVIESGLFDVFVDDKKVGAYENRGSFGELALMYNCPRAATIVATTPGILWAMDRESFLKIVLHAAFKKRRMYEELLASANILGPLTDYERTNLADALVSREYTDGEEVCHEGDLGDEMFFVEQGEVLVLSSRGSDGTEKELRKIVKGGYFGELALLTDGHRNATIKAVNNVRLAVLDRSSFERLMGPCVDLMKGQSKAYLDDIISRLGKEAVAKYPNLVSLLGPDAQLPTEETKSEPAKTEPEQPKTEPEQPKTESEAATTEQPEQK